MNCDTCDCHSQNSKDEELYKKYRDSKQKLIVILKNCPKKGEMRNLCTKRNSFLILPDICRTVDNFLRYSKALLDFMTLAVCTPLCFLNLLTAQTTLNELLKSVRGTSDFNTWDALHAVSDWLLFYFALLSLSNFVRKKVTRLSSSIDEAWNVYHGPFSQVVIHLFYSFGLLAALFSSTFTEPHNLQRRLCHRRLEDEAY